MRSTNIGLALMGLGRHAEALANFDAALAVDPNSLGALANTTRTASQPSSIAKAASLAVPIPASRMTGTPACSTIIAMLCGFRTPRPDPIGAPSGMTAAHPARSSWRARTGSSLV